MQSVEECIWHHARPLQDALHCVTSAKIQARLASPDGDYSVGFQHAPDVTIRRAADLPSLLLAVRQGFRIFRRTDATEDPDFQLVMTYYYYTLMDREGKEIVSHQWHPANGGVNWPHLHIGSSMIDSTRHDLGRRFSSLHLPTSRISIEQVIEALITQFDVTPLRADWQRILDAGQSAFKESRIWA